MIRLPYANILFLSTLSLRRATTCIRDTALLSIHFYPRSPCGERLWPGLLARPFFIISIHALLAESDRVLEVTRNAHTDFYPRSPCGERQAIYPSSTPPKSISIHALLAESDRVVSAFRGGVDNFYPRSPCGERRRCFNVLQSLFVFLSTLSLRRATGCGQYYIRAREISIHALLAESDTALLILPTRKPDFYPRSPCGERRNSPALLGNSQNISIHALLAESDGGSGVGSWPRGIFLSTLSLRRATENTNNGSYTNLNFYPRSPCGERRIVGAPEGADIGFLSTLSLRRATDYNKSMLLHLKYFYPRSPCGERQA